MNYPIKYRLSNKQFGVKTPLIECEFELPLKIVDICHSKKYGFVFIAGSAIGYVNNGELVYPLIGNPNVNHYSVGYSSQLLYPTSISSTEDNIVYISQHGGKSILEVDLKNEYSKELIVGSDRKSYLNFFVNSQGEGTSEIFHYKGNLYWTLKELNRCFMFRNNKLSLVAGNGSGGYSTSGRISDSMLNEPSGVCAEDGYVYIADKGNHCVRRIDKNGIVLAAGHPSGDMLPRKIIVKNAFIYLIDGNVIKSVNPKLKSNISTFYESDGLVSIMNADHGIYVLEIVKDAAN